MSLSLIDNMWNPRMTATKKINASAGVLASERSTLTSVNTDGKLSELVFPSQINSDTRVISLQLLSSDSRARKNN